MDCYLMSKDKCIGYIKDTQLIQKRLELLPLYLARGGDFLTWLRHRAIDRNRPHSRLLKKVFRINPFEDDVISAITFNAATITDTYWIKFPHENISYSKVRFTKNSFAELAINGSFEYLNKIPERTPELTNIGSYEKGWRLVNGVWWLEKIGNPLEIFSELFIYKFGVYLGFDMAEYKKYKGNIRSRDFTDNARVNFEPMFGLVHENDNYVDNYKVLCAIDQALAYQYVDIIFMDTICLNADRHTFNYGVLRDVETGKILRMAPNFDNNIALISRGYSKYPRSGATDIMAICFNQLLNFQPGLKNYIKGRVAGMLTPSALRSIARSININVDIEAVVNMIMQGYSILDLN